MDLFFRVSKFFNHWLDRVNEHSLHSPYMYDLYTKVVKSSRHIAFEQIEAQRREFLSNPISISYKDPGKNNRERVRTISDIAKSSLSDPKYSKLYYRLISYFQPAEVIELGTSLGINTLYLAQAGLPVYTFEGVPELIELDKAIFSKQGLNNVTFVEGNIDVTLPAFLETKKSIEFIFFDANHTYEATMRYFYMCVRKANDKSIFIFDDIYWSKEMAKAWDEIKSHPAVQITIDFYRCGVAIFNPSLTKEHYVLSL